MAEILCTSCGAVGEPAGGTCAKCGSRELLPTDAPAARRFIEACEGRRAPKADSAVPSVRAEATGKVLGRALGRLFGK